MAKNPGEPSWKYRRLMTFVVMAFAGWQLHRLTSMADTRVNETIAWGWQVIMAVLALCYTGFATVQDVVAIWTTRTARPYADPPVDPVPAPPAPDTVVVVPPAQPGRPE